MRLGNKYSFRESANDLEFIKYLFCVRSIFKFIREILSRPMFVMFTPEPKSGGCDIVNYAVECNPDFRFVLAVSQCQLRFCYYGKIVDGKQFLSFKIFLPQFFLKNRIRFFLPVKNE